MRKPLSLPAQQALLRKFTYNPDTGELKHNNTLIGKHRQGDIAGYINNKGYYSVWAINNYYLVHRIIWKMVYNEDPIEIDHIDRNRSNNKLNNLRAIKLGVNQQNRPNIKEHVGIRLINRRYKVRITVNSKEIHIGTFPSLETAIAARKAAEIKYNRVL